MNIVTGTGRGNVVKNVYGTFLTECVKQSAESKRVFLEVDRGMLKIDLTS